MTNSWGHQLRLATQHEREYHDKLGGCVMGRQCGKPVIYRASYMYVTGRAGRRTDARRFICEEHGQKFAKKYMAFQSSGSAASDAAPPASPNQPQAGGANLSYGQELIKAKRAALPGSETWAALDRALWLNCYCIDCGEPSYPEARCRPCRDKSPPLPMLDIDAMDPLHRNELEKGNDDATHDARNEDRWWPDRGQPATAAGFIQQEGDGDDD